VRFSNLLAPRVEWQEKAVLLANQVRSAVPLNLYSGGGKLFQRRYIVDFVDTTVTSSYLSTLYKLSHCAARHALLVVGKEDPTVQWDARRFSIRFNARPTGSTMLTVQAWITSLSSSSIECGLQITKSKTGQTAACGTIALMARDTKSLKRKATAWHTIARDFHGPKFAPVVFQTGKKEQHPAAQTQVQVRGSDCGAYNTVDISGLVNVIASIRPKQVESEDFEWRLELLADVFQNETLLVQMFQANHLWFNVYSGPVLVARAWILPENRKMPIWDLELNVGSLSLEEPMAVLVQGKL